MPGERLERVALVRAILALCGVLERSLLPAAAQFFSAAYDFRRGIDLQGIGALVVDAVCLLADMPAAAERRYMYTVNRVIAIINA